MPKRLTEKMIDRLRVPKQKAYLTATDTVTKGLMVKVTPADRRIFVLQARRGTLQPKLTLGTFPQMSLSEARTKANHWWGLIAKGVDPKEEERRLAQEERRAAALRQAQTFGAVCERYFAEHLSRMRRAERSEKEIRRNLLPKLGHRPIAEIRRHEIVDLVRSIAIRAPAVARNALGHCKSIFTWAVETDAYGLDVSPAVMIRPKKLIGEKHVRTRVLDDDELRSFVRACEKIGWPYGPFFHFVLLTGARRTEASGASWREIDLDKKMWIVPSERFKSGQEHRVPLSADAVALLRALPRFAASEHIFTFGNGKPLGSFSQAKAELDKLMSKELGDDVPQFCIHDLRRTFRTRLSELHVDERVAEMAIGHGKRGLARVYDQHEFQDEIRHALQRWADRLRSIVAPGSEPDNVVTMRKRRRA
jgi:integrase